MGTYLRPVANATIEDSWQGHKNRNPPSAEPGTDYGCAYGSNVLAATNGVIQYVDTNPDGADGRVVGLAADDGNYIRYLHLSQSLVTVGQRVTRGQAIAKSGASGNGSNNYYGAHVHVSLWINGTPSSQGYANTVDFENHIGNETTPTPGRKQDENMRVIRWATNGGQIFTVGQEFIKYETNGPQALTMASILNGGAVIDVNHEGFNAIQLSMGIPWTGVQMATQGKGYTPDGVRVTTGGHIWSRVMEIKNK